MKTVALLLAFLATAKAQCSAANFGLKIQDGEPIGEGDVFTDLPLSCQVTDPFLGGDEPYDCRLFRQVSRNRCLTEANDMSVTVEMKWEVKNTKSGSAKVLMDETWVDFTGPAIAGGSLRVTPTMDNANVWISGDDTRIFTASATVNKCEPSFDVKLRVKEQAMAGGEAFTCVKINKVNDLILRRCPLNIDVKCYVKNSITGEFLLCDDVMEGIQGAADDEKADLFLDNFCDASTVIDYEYILCSESTFLDFKHRTSGAKQTRAFLQNDGSQQLLEATYPDLTPEECKVFKTTIPSVDCAGVADPSVFPKGIYDVNGKMLGKNQNKIDRRYTGCWERTQYEFLALDAPDVGEGNNVPDGPMIEPTPCPTAAPAASPMEDAPEAMIQFTVPQTFKKSAKCGKGGKGGKGEKPTRKLRS